MYYNKFKYQSGGRAEFLERSFTKLVKSGLVGNMTFRNFAGLPPTEQQKLIGKLSNSNINQYRYGGRYKAQLSAFTDQNSNNYPNAFQQTNNSNLQNMNVTGKGSSNSNINSWGKNANVKSGLVGLGGAGAQVLGSKIAGDAKADTGQAFAGNIIGGIGEGVSAGAAFGPIGAAVGAGLGVIKSTVNSVNAKNQYLDSIAATQKPTKVGQLKSSYNPQISTLQCGGKIKYQMGGAVSNDCVCIKNCNDTTTQNKKGINFYDTLINNIPTILQGASLLGGTRKSGIIDSVGGIESSAGEGAAPTIDSGGGAGMESPGAMKHGGTLRYNGSAQMESAYAKHRGTLNDNEYSFTGKGVLNTDSQGVKRAGYQVGGNTEMREYPTFKGKQLQYKFFNELKYGGDFEPEYELQDGGEANVEVESGEAIMADPRGLTLHGGAWSENESPVGMMVKGAEHGEKNAAGTEGIPVSFNDKSANPDGAFVYSKYLTTDGKLAKGKGDTPRDSVAGKVKPLLKYAEKLTKEKMNDKYYNNPVAMQAIQEEMQYLKDRAMEGKFMHGLNKMLTKKDRNFNEIMDYIVSNNPNSEAQTVEGVGGVEQMNALANNPNVPPMNPQDDPNAQLLEQTKNETLIGMQQDKQLNSEPNMMRKNGGQLPQGILESRMRASGASQNEIDRYLQENYKKGGWIQDATESMKEKGTEGVCTGSKFGGPTCPPGSKRYTLAKTFKKMAKNRQEGGYMDDYYDDDYDEIEDEYIYRNGGYTESDHYGYKPTGGLTPEGYYVGGYIDKMVYEDGGHVGYKPTSYTEAPEGYYIGGYEDRMAYGYGGKYLQDGGMMRKKMQMSDPLVPTNLPITPVNTWDLDDNQQFDVPNYLNYRNNLRKNQGFKPLDWNKRPTDPKEQLDWDNELKNLKEQLDQEKEFNKDPANRKRPSPFRQSLEMMRECPDYNCPEMMKIGGYMNRYRSGGTMIPTYQNAWRNRQYSQPVNEDYYGETSHITADKTTPYRMGGMMADGPCPKGFIQVGNDCFPDPNVYNKVDNTYSDQNRQSDMFSKAMEKRFSFQAPEEKYTNALTIPQGRTNTMNPGDTIPIKKNNYTYFPDQEAFGKVPYHMTNPPVKGVIPTSQYIKDYSPYKTPYEMGGNIGYSRNQSLYGGMINTQTSPFWGGYRTKGQEGMEMEQPQPQGDPQLAQARQAMLQGAGQPQGPVADPMMEDMLMQQMEQGAMPSQGGQQMQQPQPAENPIMMLAQALPDWFKTSESQGGLGIFTQPAVAQLRKAGFSDREIATFNPNQVDPNSPIVQFLAQEASSSQGAQGMQPEMMQPEMQQMRRGGSMKHLKKGEYVKFQMGGTVYEGKVKYYDPYTGNFELDDNY